MVDFVIAEAVAAGDGETVVPVAVVDLVIADAVAAGVGLTVTPVAVAGLLVAPGAAAGIGETVVPAAVAGLVTVPAAAVDGVMVTAASPTWVVVVALDAHGTVAHGAIPHIVLPLHRVTSCAVPAWPLVASPPGVG